MRARCETEAPGRDRGAEPPPEAQNGRVSAEQSAEPPQAPEWLSVEARAVWQRLSSDDLTGADPEAVAVYCCAVVDYQRARETIDRAGQVLKGKDGQIVRNPLTIVMEQNAATIRALSQQLGIGQVKDEHKRQQAGWRNQAATERTLTALRAGGRLEEVDSAAAALARHLARALDQVNAAQYPAQTASLARVQLAALRTLRGIEDDQNTSGVDELLAYLSAPLGNTAQP